MIFFSFFSSKAYGMTPHLNCQIEMVQMRGHNICLYAEFTKLSLNTPSYLELSRSLLFPVCVCVCEGRGKVIGEWVGHGYK